MKPLIVFDLGNTNIVMGIFEGGKLLAHYRSFTHRKNTSDEYGILFKDMIHDAGVKSNSIKGVGISCVVPALYTTFEEMCEKHFKTEPLFINTSLKSGLKFPIDRPADLGADLLAAAAAAYEKHGGPCVVIDFGTATTFSALSGKGEFQGVSIAPGISISAEALYSFAPHLPRIKLIPPPSPIGTNTVHCMQSGILLGHAGMVDSMTEHFKKILGKNTKVIATGGIAGTISKNCKNIDKVDPLLVLEGIRIIFEKNKK